jgi:hypothetical protein
LGVWIAFIWLRLVSGGELLWTLDYTYGFHKSRRISWLAERTVCFSSRTLVHGVNVVCFARGFQRHYNHQLLLFVCWRYSKTVLFVRKKFTLR